MMLRSLLCLFVRDKDLLQHCGFYRRPFWGPVGICPAAAFVYDPAQWQAAGWRCKGSGQDGWTDGLGAPRGPACECVPARAPPRAILASRVHSWSHRRGSCAERERALPRGLWAVTKRLAAAPLASTDCFLRISVAPAAASLCGPSTPKACRRMQQSVRKRRSKSRAFTDLRPCQQNHFQNIGLETGTQPRRW